MKHISAVGDTTLSAKWIVDKRLNLPASLQTIEPEAFAGALITSVLIPEGCLSVQAGAFADCRELREAHVPYSVTEIAPDAFDGCENVCLFGVKGSYVETYAKENGVNFKAE